jgi:hypothetical protein
MNHMKSKLIEFGFRAVSSISANKKTLLLPAALLIAGQSANAIDVYVGGGLNYSSMSNPANDSRWSFVRTNANGWYLNNFMLRDRTASESTAYCRAIADRMSNKNAFYETDLRFATDLEDKGNIDEIRGSFNLRFATVNGGYTSARRDALKWRDAGRPVMRMIPPWQVGGDFANASFGENRQLQNDIRNCQGSATDGPMTLWTANSGKFRIRDNFSPARAGGSSTLVNWVKSINSGFQTMVMMAPNESNGPEFLSRVQDCVRIHERFGSSPKIYVVSFYGPPRFTTPVLPESVSGRPAATMMGATFWIINHLRDPSRFARLSVPDQKGIESINPENYNLKVGSDTATVSFSLKNSSDWLDLVPVVRAAVNDPEQAWNVSYLMNGTDITASVNSGEGLSFTSDELRLWPGDERKMEIKVTPKNPASLASSPATIDLTMFSHPGEMEKVHQKMQFKITRSSDAGLLSFVE